MNDKFCFDTTTLAYAYDESYPKEREICKNLVGKVFNGELAGVVTNQILGELFNVLTSKIEKPVDAERAEIIVKSLIESVQWEKINYTYETVEKAINTLKTSKSHFWDTVIAETMKENGIVKIYTENEKDFKKIPGIKVINPIKENSKKLENEEND